MLASSQTGHSIAPKEKNAKTINLGVGGLCVLVSFQLPLFPRRAWAAVERLRVLHALARGKSLIVIHEDMHIKMMAEALQ